MRRFQIPGMGLFLLAALLSCTEPEQNPPPESLIAEDTYVDLLAELQLLRSYRGTLPDSINTDSLRQAIFREYGISMDAFTRSHEYYQKDLGAQKQRIDKAIERLRQDQVTKRPNRGKTADSTAAGGG